MFCFVRLILIVCVSLFASHCFGDDSKAQAPQDHSKLLCYCNANGCEQPVKTKADWAIRRRQILKGMEAAMGKLPDRSKLPPLDIRVTKTFQGDGYQRQTMTIAVRGKERVALHLYVPEGISESKPAPAMLALHPTSTLGKDRVTMEGGVPNRCYAPELAQRGYVVVAPDYPLFGDYKSYDFENDDYISGTMKAIVDNMRCVDLLQSRKDVDPERIGTIGHSLGGHNSMFTAVFDERLKVVVSSCGWTPFHDYYGGKVAGWTSSRYMPLIKTKYKLDPDRIPFDFYEVVATIAPRAFFSSSPIRDSNFDVNGVKKGIAKSKDIFALLGATDNLQADYPDCKHDFIPTARRKAYAFIDKTFKHKPIRDVPEQ